MEKLKTFMGILACFLVIEFVLIGSVMLGFIQPISLTDLDLWSKTQTESETKSSGGSSSSSGASSSGGSSSTATKSENNVISVSGSTGDVSSVLNITLKGEYLTAYNNAVKGLSDSTSDRNKKMVAKIGLQILQSQTIKYENRLHFYSLSYSSSGGSAGAVYYSLTDCINRINSGKRIYTDCFGFVRLVHSIACYTINSSNPNSVSGLSGLYGHKGAYTGSSLSSLSKVACGTVIYDRLTGSSGDRHVAMFLYASGNSVVYMDQGGIKTGEHKYSSYIYSAAGSKPYKFNTYKNYC